MRILEPVAAAALLCAAGVVAAGDVAGTTARDSTRASTRDSALDSNSAAAKKALAVSDGLRARLASLPEEYVLVQVWSPFCAPCGQEVSELNALLRTANARARRLAVLGVPVRSRQREIEAFIRHFKPDYDQWQPDKPFQELASSSAIALPWTFLLNKNRAVVEEWVGRVGAAEVLSKM